MISTTFRPIDIRNKNKLHVVHVIMMWPAWVCRVAQSEFSKNPEISDSSRKSSLGAAEEVHSAGAKYRESKVRGGVVAELSTKKSVDSSKYIFFRRIPRSQKNP